MNISYKKIVAFGKAIKFHDKKLSPVKSEIALFPTLDGRDREKKNNSSDFPPSLRPKNIIGGVLTLAWYGLR